jgi:hypothetical protein
MLSLDDNRDNARAKTYFFVRLAIDCFAQDCPTACVREASCKGCVGQHLRKSPLVETKIETTKNRSAKKSQKNLGSHMI